MASRRKYVQRDGGTADGFSYDKNGQIITFIREGTLSGTSVTSDDSVTTGMTFDASGNRASVASGGTTTNYGTNSLNQYASVGTITPSYGNNGNLSGYDGWSYTYDARSRLKTADKGSNHASFFYDGLGRQVARTVNGLTTYSVWDGWNVYAEYQGAGSTPSERLVYGAGGDLVKSPNRSRFYYPDAQGSTMFVAGSAGTILESYTYDLTGAPRFFNATGVEISQTAYDITHLYTGQPWYQNFNLYDLRHRFLRTDIGRFLQPDPIGFAGDAANLYRYVANNPVNKSDPYGLDGATVETGPIVVTGRNVPRARLDFGSGGGSSPLLSQVGRIPNITQGSGEPSEKGLPQEVRDKLKPGDKVGVVDNIDVSTTALPAPPTPPATAAASVPGLAATYGVLGVIGAGLGINDGLVSSQVASQLKPGETIYIQTRLTTLIGGLSGLNQLGYEVYWEITVDSQGNRDRRLVLSNGGGGI